MAKQNFSNHKRYVFMYHGVLFALITLTVIGSIVNLSSSIGDHHRLYNAALIVVISTSLVLLFFYARSFALRAQDRAIRAEENLRHYVLAGSLLDRRLTMRQIIALRFAPDNEFPALAKQAAETGMSSDEIKRSVKEWRPDFHRA